MDEIWKDIEGYEGLYQISNIGRVKSFQGQYGKKCIIRKLVPTGGDYNKRNHYLSVILNKNGRRKSHLVHRLVADHFLLNPNNLPQVNHLNGIKNDNRVENLEWCTLSRNMRHAFNNGLRKPSEYQKQRASEENIGEKNYNAKLTEENVLEIRELIKKEFSLSEIGQIYNCSASAIYNIKNGKSWSHI